MTKTIQKEVGKDEYKLKISNNSIKILPANPDAYRKLTKLLKNLNANFHSYKLKQERPFRVVLRLMNSIVNSEPPLVKKEIVQCKRCRRYGHTQKYCNHNFRGVKCAGNHPTDQCTKSPETPAKCIHRQGEHPANYKGCSAYKTLHNIKYPKLRPKDITIQEPRPQKLTSPSVSYAQATQGNVNNSKTHSVHTENRIPTPQNTDNFTRLEKLIEKQTKQINNLLSLLTLFIDKFIRTEAK